MTTLQVTVVDTAKSTDQFMTPLGRSRDKRDLGAFDVRGLALQREKVRYCSRKGLKLEP